MLHLNSRLCWKGETGALCRFATVQVSLGRWDWKVQSHGNKSFSVNLFIFGRTFWCTSLIDTFIWQSHHSSCVQTKEQSHGMTASFFLPNRVLLSYVSESCLDFQHILQYNSQLLNTGHFGVIMYSYCATGMCLFRAFHKLGSGDICHSTECA